MDQKEIKLSWSDVETRAASVFHKIQKDFPGQRTVFAYGVPNGGVFAALCVVNASKGRVAMVESTQNADIYIDDIFDSGTTIARMNYHYGHRHSYFLVHKREEIINDWVSFPWERSDNQHPSGPEDSVIRMLEYIGEDPTREGLKDTPKRVVKSWDEMFSGYKEDPAKMITVFEDGVCDEMVVLRDIEFSSHCEHHLLPFMGKAHVAYVPDKRVIGVSKLVRLLEVFSKRLQIQEKLCQQVTRAIDEHLQPKGSACIIEASHLCMMCRGVRKQHSVMVTSSLSGVFKNDQAARQELMTLIRQR